jgi:paraquat-inducible protein A
MIACPDCGLLETLPPLRPDTYAVCRLCDAVLERTTGRSITATLGCSLATFLLLFPSNLLPVLQVRIFGMHNRMWLGTGVVLLWNHDWPVLAALIGAFAIVLPFVRFGLLSFARTRGPGRGRRLNGTFTLPSWGTRPGPRPRPSPATGGAGPCCRNDWSS